MTTTKNGESISRSVGSEREKERERERERDGRRGDKRQ
jgi:hypothetical protein